MFSTRLLLIAAMVMAMLPTGSFAVEKVNLSSSLEPLACSQPGPCAYQASLVWRSQMPLDRYAG